MSENMNIPKYREQQLDILRKDPGNSEAIMELMCANVLICEENIKDFCPAYKNAKLCREILYYMPEVLKHTADCETVINICSRAADTLFNHPRLKVELLMVQRKATIERGGDEAEDMEIGIDDLSLEILWLQKNILAADDGRFDDIQQKSHLKHDPVEWTGEYEAVIAEAEEKAYTELADIPKGMGFCHAYWPTIRRILNEDYGIDWKSPSEMNPRVLFD